MPEKHELPKISNPLLGGFRVFTRRFLRKHFHTVAVNREQIGLASFSAQTDSLVIYANHASWWDPMLAIYLAESVFPEFRMYAPIDARAFAQYRMFGYMGFYPVEQDNLSGAGAFLRTSKRILNTPGSSIWITPEGRFADVRDQQAPLMPGLAHLGYVLSGRVQARDPEPVGRTWFVPLATEYVFWEERLPEILVRFGMPLTFDANDRLPVEDDETVATRKAGMQRQLTKALRDAQQELAQDSIARNTAAFEPLLASRSGTFFIYDWWRAFSHWARRQEFKPDHSQLWQSSAPNKRENPQEH